MYFLLRKYYFTVFYVQYKKPNGGDTVREYNGEGKLMAKPIEATPILKGQDLMNFAKALKKKDSESSRKRRNSALSLLRKVSK